MAPTMPDPKTPAEALRVLPTSQDFVFLLQEPRENWGIHQPLAWPLLKVLTLPRGLHRSMTTPWLALAPSSPTSPQGVRLPKGLQQDGSWI